jgi:hypothetical protein
MYYRGVAVRERPRRGIIRPADESRPGEVCLQSMEEEER